MTYWILFDKYNGDKKNTFTDVLYAGSKEEAKENLIDKESSGPITNIRVFTEEEFKSYLNK